MQMDVRLKRNADPLATAVVDYSREAIISRTMDGLITGWNPAAEFLFGYASSAVLGQRVDILVPAAFDAEQQRIDSQLAAGHTVEAFDTLRQTRAGELVHVALSAAPIFDRAGNTLGAVLVLRDIQQRKRLEARLRFFESVITGSNDAITTRDLNGVITSWNPAAERLYGYSANEAIGRPLAMMLPPEHLQELDAILDQIKSGKRVEHFETVRVRRDGTRVAISLSASPILDEFGHLTGVCAIARDVSVARARRAEMERWALQDPLTGLPNRRALLDRLAVVMEKTRRSGVQAALLFIDLDDFKRINDLAGHAGGDAVLVEVAARAQQLLRAGDTVARMGGDEFVVLLDDLGFDRQAALLHATAVGQKLVDALAAVQVLGLSCSASVGLLMFSDGESPVEEMLQRADRAMYAAKKAGKNRLCVVPVVGEATPSQRPDEPPPPAPPHDPD